MEFLKGGLFDRDFMQTKVSTNRMSFKEKLCGYVAGPGMVMIYYVMVLSLRELYYMQVLKLNEIFNNNYTYFALQTTASVIGVLTGFLATYLTEHTVSRAGRFRPYVLIGTWIMALSGIAMFWTPFANGTLPQLIWLYVFNIIYYGIGVALFNQRNNVLSVSTRNVLERNSATVLRSTFMNMIPGTIVALVVLGFLYDSVLLPDSSGTIWRLFIAVPAVVAMVFSVVEYFYTRERITEDNRKILKDQAGADIPRIPVGKQFKALVTSKYFMMSVVVLIAATFYDYLQGANSRTYMIQYILGGNAENNYQFLYLIISMQPMAIGAVVVPLLARKFGARKIMMVSALITLAGLGISLLNPYSFVNAVAGGFIFACGIFAVSNMYNVFQQQASDDIEYRHGFRPEGTVANGIIVAIYTLAMTPFSSIYETVLSSRGFQAPVTDAATGITTVFQQNAAVNNWIIFAYYGSYALFAVVVLTVCIFFNMEKRMPVIQAELRARAKKAAEDRGEVYVSPEEQDALERAQAEKEMEEARIADLKALCAKKGLDFEAENQKYLDKQAARQARKQKKAGK